jgi:4-amino-4-deoxy-L-arabinose transferase-like glycosyltransferase
LQRPKEVSGVWPRAFALRPWLALLLLALAVRLLPALDRYVIGTDEAAYLTLGQQLAAGRGFTLDGLTPHTEFDPGYPLAAAAVYALLGPYGQTPGGLDLPARLNMVLAGALLVLPVYALAAELFGRSVAWRAGLLVALLPALALGAVNFGAAAEQLYSLWVWLGLLALWRALAPWRAGGAPLRPALFALAGLCFGLAHLTRWEGVFFLASGAAGIALLALLRRGRAPGYRAALAGLAAFAAAGALAVLAYGSYLYTAQGTWFPNKGLGQQLQGEAVDSGDPLAWERLYAVYETRLHNQGVPPEQFLNYLWERRAETAGLYLRNLVRQAAYAFSTLSFVTPLWLPFALAGALAAWRRGRAGEIALLLLLAWPTALVYPLAFVDPRYLLALAPAALILAGAGLVALEGALQDRAGRLRPLGRRAMLTAGLGAALLIATVAGTIWMPRPFEYKTLGLAMRARGIAAGEAVLARKRQVPFYAGARWEWLPLADLAGVRAYARERRAHYFVVDERTAPLRPALQDLLDPQAAPAGVRAVLVETVPPRIVLYAFEEPAGSDGDQH